MANYYAKARSNYFAVKDTNAFLTWADERSLDVVTQHDKLAIFSQAEDGWPSSTTEGEDCDVIDELPTFLVDGEVAVLMQSGSEASRYVDGYAHAIHSSGEVETISLDDIYQVAFERWGAQTTRAAY